MTAFKELIYMLTRVSIRWSPFNILQHGDLILSHLLKL